MATNKFLSLQPVEHAHADGIVKSIKEALSEIDISENNMQKVVG